MKKNYKVIYLHTEDDDMYEKWSDYRFSFYKREPKEEARRKKILEFIDPKEKKEDVSKAFKCLGSVEARDVNEVYFKTQNIDERNTNVFLDKRSMNLGDVIIENDEKVYIVDSIGFLEYKDDEVISMFDELCK